MRGQLFQLSNPQVRERLKAVLDTVPHGFEVIIREPTRTTKQNSKLWAMLTDISRAEPEGRKWNVETWKCAFMHHLQWQMKFCQSLEGNDPFPVGYRSSKMNKRQFADLINAIYEYGEKHGVRWSEPVEVEL